MNRLDQAKTALVLGLGSSGLAAVRLLRRRGLAVTAADAKAPDAQTADELKALGAGLIAPCGDSVEAPADLVVVSPGVREDGPWVRAWRAKGVPVISEIELGWLCRGRAKVLAVTGSNGKSTLVKLCAEALGKAGFAAVPCGNYGRPVCDAVLEREWDWLVIEVSTFQLETVDAFRPDIGILTNLFPNHLDRHGSWEIYVALKGRLFSKMGTDGLALVHEGALASLPAGTVGASRPRLFGAGPGCDARYEPGRVVAPGGAIVSILGTPFDNPVLGPAAAAAAAALEAAGAPPGALEAAAAGFVMLPHRMQPVRAIGGVRFVNDSKATNLAALGAALRMTPAPVRLIAGGLLKETDLETVKDLLVKKCAKVYGIGKTAPFLKKVWGDWVPFEDCHELERAVRAAWREAQEGDTVLLSPGCASFDQFRNFEERGARFICVVQALETEKARP